MKEVYVTDAQLAARYGVHRSTIWRWVKTAPQFPEQVVFSPGCTRWKLSEIEAWESRRASNA
jgi:prophage regulatory protein